MSAPEIPCKCCKGRGTVPMPPHLEDTWKLLRRTRDVLAWDVAEAFGVSAPAANNSLKALVDLGLATRRQIRGEGRTYVYRRAPSTQPRSDSDDERK